VGILYPGLHADVVEKYFRITRILRHPISKGKAQEGENYQYWEKWGNLGQFSIIFELKPLFLGSWVR